MRVPWIRVHGALIDRPVVTRMVETLKVKPHEAVGILVTLWSAVASHATNGVVSGYSDFQIETWARWRGRTGALAKWLRDHHLDDEGRIREWDDYAGKLETIRERDRQRKADRRRKVDGSPADIPQNSTPARANGTERNGTVREEQQEPGGAQQRTPAPEWLVPALAIWTGSVGHVTETKLKRALSPLVTKHGWDAVKGALEVYVSPDEGPAAKGRDRRADWFAADFQRWHTIALQPLQDANGDLTARARRLGGVA